MTSVYEGGEDLTGEVKAKASPMIELGTTGLKRSAGYINEEFLPALKGRKAIQVFREMCLAQQRGPGCSGIPRVLHGGYVSHLG
jgi:hypothetical protein